MLLRLLSLVAVLQVVLTSEVNNVTNTGIDPKLDFVTIGDHRYYFSPLQIEDITLAVHTCGDVGATLVSLETLEEYDAVTNYIASQPNLRTKTFWTSGMFVYSKWTWTGTGRVMSHMKWATDEPDIVNSGLQSCMYIYNGFMYDATCSLDYYVICEENNCSTA